MSRPAPAPAVVRRALKTVAAGTPLREIAGEIGVSAMTISRWSRARSRGARNASKSRAKLGRMLAAARRLLAAVRDAGFQ